MGNASECDIAAFRIANNRAITILAFKTATHIVRNVRRRISLEYFCECDCPFSYRLAPSEAMAAANDD
jgi:hypothetical protein